MYLYEFNLIKIPKLISNALNGISISIQLIFNYDSGFRFQQIPCLFTLEWV
jgi:hypothetical protein